MTVGNLIDSGITPDPWNPADGDVYQRPTTMGWDRIVVLKFTPERTRPAMHDISENVTEPARVADVHRLPTHQVKLFRAFCTAEAFDLGARLAAKPRPLRWLIAPFAGFGAAIKIYKYGKALGLPIRTMHRVAAQLDREWDSPEQGGREDGA